MVLKKTISTVYCLFFMGTFSVTALSAITGTSGSVHYLATPNFIESDTLITAFDEHQNVAFLNSQGLDHGNIEAGTLVNSHYIQYDTLSPTGSVSGGTVVFDGIIVGLVTSDAYLDQDLNPEIDASSDSYFGLYSTLGEYPSKNRRLGNNDFIQASLGSNTLTIDSMAISVNHAVDGIRVFTVSQVPIPPTFWLFGSSLLGLMAIARKN